jgi:putative hydrolase of the HAD superfamily
MLDNHKNLVSKIKKPAVKAVIFDLDDTLWPLFPLIHDAERALFDWLQLNAPRIAERHTIESMRSLRQQLVPTDARFTYDLWALRHAMLTQLFSAEETDAGRVRHLSDTAMQVFAKARNQVSLYQDVRPVLNELDQSFKLGTISNGFADLNEIGLAKHFQVNLAAHQFGCAKPDPRIFRAACSALQVEPGQTVYVGDDVLIDVQGAKRAGLQSVWLNRAGRLADHEADYACRDMRELLLWLQK